MSQFYSPETLEIKAYSGWCGSVTIDGTEVGILTSSIEATADIMARLIGPPIDKNAIKRLVILNPKHLGFGDAERGK